MKLMQRKLGDGFAVVVGAAALVAGVLTTSSPASAQWHRNDFGAGNVAGAATGVAAGVLASAASANAPYGYGASAYDAGYAGCTWQRQRVWDGYAWQVQRIEVCD